MTETLSTFKKTQEKQAFTNKRSATVAAETAAEKLIEYDAAKENRAKLEAQAQASKVAETEKKQELEEAKTATQLALALIPADETHADHASSKKAWHIKTALEVFRTSELAKSTRTRQNIEKDLEAAATTEANLQHNLSTAIRQT